MAVIKTPDKCKNSDCFNEGKQIYRGYCRECWIRLNQGYHSAQADGIATQQGYDLANPSQESQSVGLKYDRDKLPYDLLPYDALDEVVSVLRYGAKKYTARNWENGIHYSRLYAATIRHMKAFFQEREDIDPESSELHLAHAGANILFLLALHKRGSYQFDDRPNSIITKLKIPYENSNPKTDKDIEPF